VTGMLSGVMAEESQAYPRIVVAFQNYAPPFDAEKAILQIGDENLLFPEFARE